MSATATQNKIVVVFGDLERPGTAPNTYEELLESVFEKFPQLKEHSSTLTTQYIDDEGDAIVVSTDEELKEAYDVGSIAGTLHVKIVLPVEIHQAVVDKVAQLNVTEAKLPSTDVTVDQPKQVITPVESGESIFKSATNPVTVQTISKVRLEKVPTCVESRAVPTNSEGSLDQLQKVRQTVVSEVNHAFEVASEEIKRLLQVVSSKSIHESAITQELKDTKENLENVNANHKTLQQRVINLNIEVEKLKKKEQHDAARIAELESQVRAGNDYKSKYKTAEQARLKLSNQLEALKTGLLALAQEKK